MPAAYQDENGKWFKKCSTTKQVFGGVDTKEELGQWFDKESIKKDGLRTFCKESQKQKKKQYRQENLQKLKERDKIYYQNNKDKIKQRNQTANGMYVLYKKRANRRGINFTLTLEWFEEQSKLPEFNVCSITGTTFVQGANHPFSRSLDRIISTKGYTPENVRWICFKLNSFKSDLKLEEIALIVKYMCDKVGYDPVEYMREIAKGNNKPHLSLMTQAAK